VAGAAFGFLSAGGRAAVAKGSTTEGLDKLLGGTKQRK
jgi:hypothetical protein